MVGAVQFRAGSRTRDEALAALAAHTDSVAEGCQLVVLPEMAATGYLFDDIDDINRVAEPREGPTLAALAPVARRHGCFIVVGYPERDGGARYNSALVIDPDGHDVFNYRKTLLFEADERWAQPGDSGYRVFHTSAGAFTVGICMDLNHDNFVAHCASADVRAVAFPTCWLDEGYDVWRYWAWRLSDVGAALVAANSWGTERQTTFSGRSAVLDAIWQGDRWQRRVLASAPASGDQAIQAQLVTR